MFANHLEGEESFWIALLGIIGVGHAQGSTFNVSLISNGDFENGLFGWQSQAQGSGGWFIQTGTRIP